MATYTLLSKAKVCVAFSNQIYKCSNILFMIKYFSLLLIILLNIGCSKPTNNEEQTRYNAPVIDLKGIDSLEDNELTISHIVDSSRVEYVKLETTKESVIEVIFDVQKTDRNIFIYNKSGLLMFDQKGKFIRVVGTYGKGPNEHLGVLGFSCTDSLIAILSNFTGKMLIYNNEGVFLKTFPVNSAAGQPSFINNSCLAINRRFGDHYDTKYYITYIVNTIGDTLHIRNLSNELFKSKNIYVPANRQWFYNDTLYIKETLNDTIYTITNNSIIPRYAIDMGKYKLPVDFFYNIKDKEKYGYKYITIGSVFEDCNCIYLVLSHNNQRKVAEYNKTTKRTKFYCLKGSQVNKYGIVEGGRFKNNIDGGFQINNLKSLRGNKLLTILYPHEMKEEKLNLKIKNELAISEIKKNEFQNLMRSTSLDDNPVLVIYTLR